MNFEQAKMIIQNMADGTATTEDEAALEEWALQHIGVDGCYGRMVVLGHGSPSGGGQSHYRSVREALEDARDIAENWHDVIHTYPKIGLMDDGQDFYAYSVYSDTYTERVEREEGGNFFDVSWAPRELGYKQETIARFSCTEGNVKDEGGSEQSGPEHLFERDFSQCENDARFNSTGLIVVCPQCIERAIATGNCYISVEV